MDTTTKNTFLKGLFSLIIGLVGGSTITLVFIAPNIQKQDQNNNSDVSNQANIEINNGDYSHFKEQYDDLLKDYTLLKEQYNDLLNKNEELVGDDNLANMDSSVQADDHSNLDTQKLKSETMMLYDIEAINESQNIKKETSGLTNKESESWAKVIIFYCDNAGSMGEKDGYAEYYTGGKYNKFKATVAPSKSSTWKKTNYVYFQVLGDNDEVLYTSDSINYKTGIFEVEVDISGQDTVSIYIIKGEGSRGPVIFRNARFE